MSRGFVKEDDQEDIPFVAPRAYLPPGTTNYVTPAGMEALLAERDQLFDEKKQVKSHNENERRVAINHINARLQLLEDRIYTARVIKIEEKPSDEIKFGTLVSLLNMKTGETSNIQITGVDEADPAKGKVSFISPLARILIKKKKGDKVVLKRAKDQVEYQILELK